MLWEFNTPALFNDIFKTDTPMGKIKDMDSANPGGWACGWAQSNLAHTFVVSSVTCRWLGLALGMNILLAGPQLCMFQATGESVEGAGSGIKRARGEAALKWTAHITHFSVAVFAAVNTCCCRATAATAAFRSIMIAWSARMTGPTQ